MARDGGKSGVFDERENETAVLAESEFPGNQSAIGPEGAHSLVVGAECSPKPQYVKFPWQVVNCFARTRRDQGQF